MGDRCWVMGERSSIVLPITYNPSPTTSAGDGAATTSGAGGQRVPLGGDAGQQLVERLDELVDALVLKLIGDGLHVDPDLGQSGDGGAGALKVLLNGRGDCAVIAERFERVARHRVNGVRADQRVGVEQIGIGLILDTGAGPERAL